MSVESIPSNPRQLAYDARFLTDPQGFYQQLVATFTERLGNPEAGADEAAKVWAEALRVRPADVLDREEEWHGRLLKGLRDDPDQTLRDAA